MAITENLNRAEIQKQPNKKRYTFEEILASPDMAHYHDVVRYLQKTPEREVFPRKFELSMQDIATDNVYGLFQENPEASLNDVISVVMDKLPKDLKPQMLLKLVQLTIETWEELTAEAACPKEDVLENVLEHA